MNPRRSLLALLAAASILPRAAFGQTRKQPMLIGWLSFGAGRGGPFFAALKEGLAERGWKEGAQIAIEGRWAEGKDERLTALAGELAAMNPAVIVASTMRVAVAAAKVAPKIPIVMVANTDPVAAGLVKSLARPGGMVTGLAGFGADLAGKHLELLREAVPSVKRVGFLLPSAAANRTELLEVVQRAARQHKVEALLADVARIDDLESAMTGLAKQGAQSLVMLPFAYLGAQQKRILAFATAQRWPVVATANTWAANGGLISYGPDQRALHRRAAYYVDRILKGARPGELPIERPTVFELTVNMKTAKALGLTMPREIMVRATSLIE